MRKTALSILALVLAAPASADVVSDWTELLTSIDKAARPTEYMFDPSIAQSNSKVSLAMFEAANMVDRRYKSYLGLAPAPSGASITAAVASAARDTLAALYPGQIKTIDDNYVLALGGIAEGAGRESGITAGKAAAVAALAAGGMDPALPQSVYRPTALAGKWAPSGLPYDIRELQFRPWFMAAAGQLRIAPPPPLDSAKYANSVNETRARGAKESVLRTKADTLAARFWASYDLDPALRQIADQPGRSVVRNARMYALIALASDDIGLMMADGKLHHAFWRPMNAIRQAEIDGNDATLADPLWEPLLRTPGQPEYPCGHCTVAAVFATILAREGKPPPGGLHFTSERMPGVSLKVADWPAYERSVNQSRIDGGVHFRFTAEASKPAGERLARMAMARLAPLN